jgi:hypothetical protein
MFLASKNNQIEENEWGRIKTVYLAGKIDALIDWTDELPETIFSKHEEIEIKQISKWRLQFISKWIEKYPFSKVTFNVPEMRDFANTVVISWSDTILFYIEDIQSDIQSLLDIAFACGEGKTIYGVITEQANSNIVSPYVNDYKVVNGDNWLSVLLNLARPILIESPIELKLFEATDSFFSIVISSIDVNLIPQVPIKTKYTMYDYTAGQIFTRADFIVEGTNIVVYCDGYTYHGSEEMFKRDRIVDKILIANGYISVRFSSAEITSSAFECKKYLDNLAKNNFSKE